MHARSLAPNAPLALLAVASALLGGRALAQQGGDAPPTASAAETSEPPQKITWPGDRDRAVCRVDGERFTVGDLIRHIDERHYPGMTKFVDTPAGQLYFQQPIVARWARQFADVKTLEKVAKQRDIPPSESMLALANALKAGFESHLADYVAQREKAGHPVELTQDRVNLLLTDYQRHFGLETEVRGWLDLLVPATPAEALGVLRDYYNDHARYFGGTVTVMQIVVYHRDPRTGELLTGAAREAAYAKLADIQARLLPDGSNFEDVARLMSDDRRTAARGGLMQGIERIDPNLPAALCRTAWQLRDDEISKPFESPFGMHLLKRRGYVQKYYIVFTEQMAPQIAATKRAVEQEDLLFGARERFGVALFY